MSAETQTALMEAVAVMDSGQKRLEEMGYKQELKRDLKQLTNFFLSVGLISALAVATPIYNIGLIYGGPASITYGWLFGGFFICIVALSLSEICSAYPTAGGLYYWSYVLGGPRWGALASWITGWFSLIGQIIDTCSLNYNVALLLQSIILLSTGGANGGGYHASKYVVMAMLAGITFSQALINSFAVSWLGRVSSFAAFWSLIGQVVLMIAIPLIAVNRAKPSTVFTSFNKDNDVGIHSSPYIFALSLILVNFTVLGYDAPAVMSEETEGADKGSAVSIFACAVTGVVTGYFYILGITFAVVDPSHLLDPANDAGGYAVAQLFYDVFHDRYGSGTGGIVCLGAVAVAAYNCGMESLTINSRVLYGFARDGAVPFSRIWRTVDKRNVPLAAVWICAAIACAAGLMSLVSVVALQATVSISTIGFYVSYGLPIFFRITVGHKRFVPGPFHLGRWSRPVGTVAVLYVVTVAVIFCLPVAYPITAETLNYAPITFGALLIFCGGGWFFYAKFWFDGPNTKQSR